MKRLLVLVEGQTEERFVKDVLGAHLQPRGLLAIPTLVETHRHPGGRREKGGSVPYSKLARQVRRLIGDTAAIAVTTMLDLYGLRGDFPGVSTSDRLRGSDKARHLEHAFAADIGDGRFVPNLVVHEFEALVFAARAEDTDSVFPGRGVGPLVEAIRAGFGSPEEIDGGIDTHPSGRLRIVIPEYDKVRDGSLLTQRIGLSRLRTECPHFGDWLKRLESL